MSYIDSNLTTGERILQRASVSWWSQAGLVVISIILFSMAAGHNVGLGVLLALIPLVIGVIRIYTTELALTNKRVIAKTGLIARNTLELRIEKVEGLMIKQGVLGRILNYGTVLVSGTGGMVTPIPFIKNPLNFRRLVNEYLENPSQFDA